MNVRQLANRIDPGQSVRRPEQQSGPARTPKQADFASLLEQVQQQAEPAQARLSSHAWQRIQQRGISMTATDQRLLGEAMQQLEAKGARDALLMRADAAFVVNVPSRTVVTAIDAHEMQERIFTQIDSAMLL